ncbi:Bcr/CflA family multidrug efflux MFS transporter [Gallibacterium sp. AGMB14963]|uniref:Bcr/CflA family multidrug efflux MFS transporter n=1 Tax=Gallibacterium faecale TaxID=3019086 RepID=UPI0022F1A960|nr:Bcr/CflA family multidrug efflux MFS transporter [Gallibacterium sp. AGMB14963]MDA3977656.1 Bcr/CflA family multidrug efflux MFS transporter [Gallibacterium sp. AGMB14963]
MPNSRTPIKPLSETALIIFLGGLVGFGPLSIDMYLPTFPNIAEYLGADISQVQFTVSTFLMGFCAGMLLYGPLSDRYGRRFILIIGMSLYVLASIACLFATNIEQLLICRFLQAFGGGATPVLGRAIVRDRFPPQRTVSILSMMQLITMLAPLLAPMIGGVLLIFFDWRSNFVLLAILGAICWIIVYFRLEETHQVNVSAPLTLTTIFHPYCIVLRNPPTVGYIFCLSSMFGGLFTYVAGTPFVYIDYFHFSPQHYGYFFGLNVIGIIICTLLNNRFAKKYSLQTLLAGEVSLVAIAGIGFAFADPNNLIAIMLPLFLFIGLTGAIAPNIMAMLLQLHRNRAGTAMALATSMQFAGGLFASAALSYFFQGTPQTMLLVLCVCSICAVTGFLLAAFLSNKQQTS